MYDLELLRKFCMVAKLKSFTKASEKLYISQPALSKSIKILENQMGIKLFKRNNKSVQLTKEGNVLYNSIYNKLDYICNIDPIIESFKQKKKRDLAIGANATIIQNILMPGLKKLLDDYPDTNIIMENKTTPELIKMLKEKRLDIIVVNLPIDNMDEFEIIELKKVQDVFFASEKYSYLKDKEINIKQLETLPIITNLKQSVVRENFDRYCSKNNVVVTPHIEAVRNSLITNFCILGLGIGFTTYEFVEKQIKENDLFVLDVRPKVPQRAIGIVIRNEPKKTIVECLIKDLIYTI